MNIKNLTPFPLGTKVTSRRPPRPEMTLILRAAYVLSPDEPLALPDEGMFIAQGAMSADTYREDDEERAGECLYPGDFADWKPRAEVMLRGTCYTPLGKPMTECPVRFEVGRWSKLLRVVGRRFWSDDLASAVMSAPAPFSKMPLGYANAFGGAGYARNPSGKGFAGRELPSVEHPGRVIRARRDDPGPAGYGPINPAWPDRAGKIGEEYGPRWRKERYPYYAEDFDWGYFNSAPPDQHIEGGLRGDETLLFQNMHPAEEVFETRLPGLRIRAFVKDGKGRFREAAMSLDTLFADLDAERLYLTWRGLDAIEADDMKDVQTVLVASEKLGESPLPEAHYRALLEAFEADPLEIAARVPADALATFDAMKKPREAAQAAAPPADPISGAVRGMLGALPIPVSEAASLEARTAATIAAILDGPKPPANAPPEASAKALEAKIADIGKAMSAHAKPPPPPAFPLRPGGPPPAWASKALAQALDQAAQAKRALAEQKLPPGLPAAEAKKRDEQIAAIDEAIAPFVKDPFFAKIADRPPPREPAPGADLHEQDYEGRDLRGADLRGANLRDANLAGAILRGARLDGACLDGAVLCGADLTGADLTGADLTLANLSGASAKGTIFREARLDRAWLEGADLSGAVLAGARGTMTILPRCDLTGADAKGISLDQAFARQAILTGADLTGATLLACHFLEADAKKVNLTRALLNRTSFHGADLAGAVLVEARGDRTVWMTAKLHDARFERAILPRASFFSAVADRASFRRAILRESRCYRASFERSDFTQANLVGVDFSKCALSRARFTGANLFDAKLRQAAREGCDFTGANLKRAAMEQA